MLDRLIKRLFENSDSDGDGLLSNSEISGLSKDAFTKLDTDGDGKLSADEIKAAVQKQMDAIKQAFETGGRDAARQKVESLKDTPEGQLMQILRPKGHHKTTQVIPTQLSAGQQTTNPQTSMLSISYTSISVNISVSSLDVTA
jgi:hypothetical protein